MKSKDTKELHLKTEAELLKLIQDAQKDLETLRLDHVQNKLKNTSGLKNLRRDLAIMQTILKEKELTKNV